MAGSDDGGNLKPKPVWLKIFYEKPMYLPARTHISKMDKVSVKWQTATLHFDDEQMKLRS